MSVIRTLFKNKLFLAGLLIPLVWQIVYFSIAIPAVNEGDTRIFDLKIDIVNEDAVMGSQIADQLGKTLPFKTEVSSELAQSLEDMDNGNCNMVIHIAGDFTARLQQGGAQIAYYINQAAPSMTKQLMEATAKSINQTLNESAFNTIKETIQKKSLASLSQSGLPEDTVTAIGNAFSQAFAALKASPIAADMQKVNDSEGFAKTALPLYIFLTYFIGSVIMTITHSLAFNSIAARYSKGELYLTGLVTNIIYSLIVPGIVISFAAGFDISFNQGLAAAWFLLSIGLFTFLSLFQMFSNWLGTIGTGVMVLLLFPLQLVSSGLIYAREILPAFYEVAGVYLPATYFGSGMLDVIYGPSVSGNVGILLLMSAIFIAVSALALFKKTKNTVGPIGIA